MTFTRVKVLSDFWLLSSAGSDQRGELGTSLGCSACAWNGCERPSSASTSVGELVGMDAVYKGLSVSPSILENTGK